MKSVEGEAEGEEEKQGSLACLHFSGAGKRREEEKKELPR